MANLGSQSFEKLDSEGAAMNSPITDTPFEQKLRERNNGRSPLASTVGRTGPKIVLIDDDPSYTSIIARCAAKEGIQLDTFNSLSELGFVALLRNYDVAIIDYDLGSLNGVEIAEYMSTLLDDMPMVLISASDRTQEMGDHCPHSVRAFVNKADGFDKILDAARLCVAARASLRASMTRTWPGGQVSIATR
ncbi:MAG: response regulator [Oxalobacteraceae bacterium]|nr:MAG: response regulator [Oxalobacteraceae bacterium]